MKRFLKKLSLFWTSIAPGIFLVGYNIGTGSITTMAAGGAGLSRKKVGIILLIDKYFFPLHYGRKLSVSVS